jgi:hypothetical protein
MKHSPALLLALSLLAACAASAADNSSPDDGSGAAGDDGSGGSSDAGSGDGGSSSDAGSGGSTGGTSAGGGSAGAATGGATGLPCEISQILQTHCWSCHGNPPTDGATMPLLTYQDLTSPSKNDPTKSNAVRSLARMKSTGSQMPPKPAAPVSAAEVTAFASWVNAGTPGTGCGAGGAGQGGSTGAGGTAQGGSIGAGGDPYGTPEVCTSGTMWTKGDSGSELMHPGLACMSCHKLLGKATGKTFDVGGTVFPTAHEPDNCDGVGVSGATVVITDAGGQEHSLPVNAAGNFYHNNLFGLGNFALPIRAKVVYNGKERVMATAQMSGDCNSCHTEKGSSNAPGRIMLP